MKKVKQIILVSGIIAVPVIAAGKMAVKYGKLLIKEAAVKFGREDTENNNENVG